MITASQGNPHDEWRQMYRTRQGDLLDAASPRFAARARFEAHMNVTIRLIVDDDRAAWARMREALWPGSLSDHEQETRAYFDGRSGALTVFVAEAEGRLVGFLELDFRKYAPGCRSSPVPFIEGWYVEPAWRGRGVGRALVETAETYAREGGYPEIGSDTEIENAGSIAAHRALGYEEVERIVCFRRSLHDDLRAPDTPSSARSPER